MSPSGEGAPTPPGDAALGEYERAKFDLADLLRALPWTAARAEPLRALFARLAEDRFNLVVVGRFSRGKSSLMNALLGRAWLPTGILPLTSVITAVSHGSEPGVVLHHVHTSLTTELPLAALEAHVTERGNPGNRERVRVAEVRLPAELLRRGFHFVDTPGLGSSIRENTLTTEGFLPEADALLLVTGFDSPLSAEELAVLQSARNGGRSVFVAVNKADMASEAERREVLAHLDHQLRAGLGNLMPLVLSVSARDGLAARLAGDAEALERSGVPALERALVGFLLRDRRRDFLRLSCDRVEAMLATDTATGPALQRLRQLRARLEREAPATTAAAVVSAAPATRPAACPVCATMEQRVLDLLVGLQGQLRRDHAAREALVAAGGLCGPHAWTMAALAAPRELCVGLAPVLEAAAATLRDAGLVPTGPDAAAAPAWAAASGCCPACEAAAMAEREALAALAATPALEAAATCLPHLGRLAALLPPATARRLLAASATRLQALAEDARRFALRQDAARPDLGDAGDRELGAWVVTALAGHHGANPSRRLDRATDPRMDAPSCHPAGDLTGAGT